MNELNSIDKLGLVLNKSWEILISKFLNGRFELTKEAPFQHQFANILHSVGELHCFSRTEMFLVDLETKEKNVFGKTKFVDITICFLENGKVTSSAAIELKFKKRSQGAEDYARIDSYVDIASLEEMKNRGYNKSYFCMITDNSIYTKKSREGTTGEIFSMRNDYIPKQNEVISNPKCKGRSDVEIVFSSEHTFLWENKNSWYFLSLEV